MMPTIFIIVLILIENPEPLSAHIAPDMADAMARGKRRVSNGLVLQLETHYRGDYLSPYPIEQPKDVHHSPQTS
ncbi:MAG: hypothetical protein ACJASC_001047 [Limimaricola cinnabarinus]|jgi:hypothetical protein